MKDQIEVKTQQNSKKYRIFPFSFSFSIFKSQISQKVKDERTKLQRHENREIAKLKFAKQSTFPFCNNKSLFSRFYPI